MKEGISVPEGMLAEVRTARRSARDAAFRQALPIIGKDAAGELRALYEQYDERIYRMFAELYDKESGGFYYSKSARDNEGFLPDIESTYQVLTAMTRKSLNDDDNKFKSLIPQSIKERLIRFTKRLQDPEDGYFYHPQWGKNIIAERKSRDFGWATRLLELLDAEPDYPTYKNQDGVGKAKLPTRFSSIEEFKRYLSGTAIGRSFYYVGNKLDSEASEIKRAGREYVDILLRWLEEHQNPENGLWEDEICYEAVSGAKKMLYVYMAMDEKYPNINLAAESALNVILSDEQIKSISDVQNPVSFLSFVLTNRRYLKIKERDLIREGIRDRAAKFISHTAKKLRTLRRADGSYGYWWDSSAHLSQGANVAVKGTNEGDINATVMATSTPRQLCQVLGIPEIPLYTEKDAELFFWMLESK